MAFVPPAARDAFGADLRIAHEACRASVVPGRVAARNSTWVVWEEFCASINADPLLPAGTEQKPQPEPLALLQVFAQRYRDGRLAKNKSNNPVRGSTVADALRDIGQTLASVGIPDPRLEPSGRIRLALKNQISSYAKEDGPPRRVRPVTVAIIRQVLEMAQEGTATERQLAIANLIVIAFFFLCRPGEYVPLQEETRSTPFRMCDTTFYAGAQCLTHAAPLNDLNSADYVTLTFNDQKNATKGEMIGHGASGDPRLCPIAATRHRCASLRAHNAPGTTPLYTVFEPSGTSSNITTSEITRALRAAAAAIFHITGIPPEEITARSLRSGGATTLLCAKVDPNTIALIGRWKSDAMLRYLIVQARPLMADNASKMLAHGNFTLAPNSDVPTEALPWFQATAVPIPPPAMDQPATH